MAGSAAVATPAMGVAAVPPAPPAAESTPWDALALAPPTAPRAWARLVAVARRTLESYPPIVHGLVSAAEVELPLVRLCVGVREVLAGEGPSVADSQALLPLRPLLDAVRRGVVEDGPAALEAVGAEEFLRVLAALETVLAALVDDSAQRFAERMAEGDAMHLVVEVAHDMRSPLSSILFLAERLRKGQSGPINTVQERQLGLVYSAAFGLSSMAGDVMELARGGDRLVGREPVPFSVAEILQSVRDIVQPMAEEKGLELRLQPLEVDWRVGYPLALNRVLLNLVTNALKFTAQGGVTVTPRVVSRSQVEFVVADSGRGIPPHVLATLYDAFRRRQQPGDYAFSSAGLGLSICRKLIAAMGGELAVDTELEKGTRFRFTLELPPARRY